MLKIRASHWSMTKQELHPTDSNFSELIMHILILLKKLKKFQFFINIFIFKPRIHTVYLCSTPAAGVKVVKILSVRHFYSQQAP